MGGKKNQAARTKGNTRPSSSGRSADKLAASGTSLTGFMSFTNLQGDIGFIPATQGNDELDATIDAEFRLVMRKMSKKDSITKLKAIQEFTSMCKERDASSVKNILPFWPRIFNRLSMDYERRIREAVFQALNAIICSVQKSIAPHLRSIMGCWLLGQCDSYGPAASAATAAFSSAFPAAKQPDALVFCKIEILNVIEDNLFRQTADSLIDADTLSPDEKEEKYVRTITSSLYALKLFFSVVPMKEHEELTEHYKKIVANDSFWKYHKHKSPQIRCAWFSLICTQLDYISELMQNNAAKLASIIFNNLDESDPIVSPQIWEAAMMILRRIKDCWQYINVPKTLIPKLRHVLRKGGIGNANIIYPCMLPLIKEIPHDKIVMDSNFYHQFFTDFRQGLNIDKVKASSSELHAIVNAFMECFSYVLVDLLFDEKEHEELLLKQLMPLIELSIQEPNCKLSSSCLYGHLAQLLRMLNSQNNEVDSSSSLNDVFWDNFQIFYRKLNIASVENSFLFKSLVNFYLKLRKVECDGPQTLSRVQFIDQEITSNERVEQFPSLLVDDDYFSDTTNALWKCLHLFLDETLQNALEFNSVDRLNSLSLICLTYSCSSLFQHLSQTFALEDTSDNSALVFFQGVIFPWIQTTVALKGTVFSQTAINFTLALYLSTERPQDKEEILNKIGQTETPTLIECLIQTKFYGRDKDVVFTSWLKADQLSTVFVSMAKRLCLSIVNDDSALPSTECDAIWSILTFILSTDEKFECMISSTCLSQILGLFHLVLPKPGLSLGHSKAKLEAGLEFVCDLASRIFKNFQGCWQIQTTEELLLNFFFLACDPPFDLSENLLFKINATLSSGIKTLLETKGFDKTSDGLFHKGFSGICDRIKSGKHLRHKLVTQACLKLLECFKDYIKDDGECDDLESESTLSNFFELTLPSVEDCDQLRTKLSDHWTLKAFTREIVTVFENEIEVSCSLHQIKAAVKYLNVIAFAARLIYEVIELDNESDYSESLQSVLQTWAMQMLHSLAFYDMIKDNIVVDANCTELETYGSFIREKLIYLIMKFDVDEMKMFVKSCCQASLSNGNLWSVGLSTLNEIMETCNKQVEVTPMLEMNETLSYIQTYQAFNRSLLSVDGKKAVEMFVAAVDTYQKIYSVAVLTRFLTTNEPTPEVKELIPVIMNRLIAWRDFENVFLFDADLKDVAKQFHSMILSYYHPIIHLNIETQRLTKVIVAKFFDVLTQTHRDFVLCGLYSWIQTCFQGDLSIGENCYGSLLRRSSCLLLKHINDVITTMENNSDHSSAVTEWNEFFSEAIFSILFPVALQIAEENTSSVLNFLEKETISSMFYALETIPLKCIEAQKLTEIPESVLHDTHNNHLPANVQTLLNHLVALIMSPFRSVQLGAYHVLQTLIPSLTKYEKDLEQIEDKEQTVRDLPYAFHSILTETTAVVNSCIAEMQVHNTAAIHPNNSNYSQLMGYLLTWDLVLDLFSSSSSELRSEYANYLQDSGLMHDLLANLFFLISEYSSQLDISRIVVDSPSKNATTKTLFSERPSLKIFDEAASMDIVHLACQVFFQAVKRLPVLVRQWWNNQDKSNSALIDKITSKYITPLLCAEEFHHIQHSEKKLESMTVRARLVAREVVATYMIDEVSMELIIKLSPNHPLGPVTVECGKRIGVGNTQWRNWMLQLNTFLIHQNGSILDGLDLWKRNVDKKFEGIEECYICFYILHGSNCQLPRQTCRTCKKKFHSACLYKWFYTSNQSTCPLCRNIFQ